MSLNLKQVIGRRLVEHVGTLVNSDVDVLCWFLHTNVVEAQVSVGLSMLEPDDVSRIDVLGNVLGLGLPVVDQLPLIEIGRAVGFILLEDLRWVWFPDGRLGPVLALLGRKRDLVLQEVLGDVHVAVVLLVVQQNVVIKDHSFSILPVLVPLLDEERDSLGAGLV